MLITQLKMVLPEINETTPPNVDLSDLMKWYRDAKLRFDAEPEFKKEAQLQVIALQGGDETALRIWEHICEISRRGYQKIYDLLDIDIHERGESFYNPYLVPLMQDLEARHLISISNGAKCMIIDGFVNRENEPLPLIMQKSDGGYNYATTDMAALKHRIQDEHGDWIIYVVDAGQSLHLNMIFKAAEKAGFYDPTKVRLDHVPFGFVLKDDGSKFKTRSGDTERLIDLIHNAIDRAKQLLQERDPNMPTRDLETAAHTLGINAIKYADLSCHRMSDYIFSYDKMLKFEGNTAAFLLYAYVRIQSIQRKIGLSVDDLMKAGVTIQLVEPSEMSLGLLVAQFPEVLEEMSKDLLPSRLTDYLYQLANRFHAFFHQCRVEGTKQQNSRLLLIETVARVLKTGLQILGLKPLERM
jgi:arginyl-tRNA synthetase